jgi:hypothetical protein
LKLSVLIPAYNEEDSVGETVREVHDVLTKENIPHEIIVINDHSTDRTEEILNKVVTEISSLRKINNPFGNELLIFLKEEISVTTLFKISSVRSVEWSLITIISCGIFSFVKTSCTSRTVSPTESSSLYAGINTESFNLIPLEKYH